MGAVKYLFGNDVDFGYDTSESVFFTMEDENIEEMFSIEYKGVVFGYFEDFAIARDFALDECNSDYWQIFQYSRNGEKEFTGFGNLPPWEDNEEWQ